MSLFNHTKQENEEAAAKQVAAVQAEEAEKTKPMTPVPAMAPEPQPAPTESKPEPELRSKESEPKSKDPEAPKVPKPEQTSVVPQQEQIIFPVIPAEMEIDLAAAAIQAEDQLARQMVWHSKRMEIVADIKCQGKPIHAFLESRLQMLAAGKVVYQRDDESFVSWGNKPLEIVAEAAEGTYKKVYKYPQQALRLGLRPIKLDGRPEGLSEKEESKMVRETIEGEVAAFKAAHTSPRVD